MGLVEGRKKRSRKKFEALKAMRTHLIKVDLIWLDGMYLDVVISSYLYIVCMYRYIQ